MKKAKYIIGIFAISLLAGISAGSAFAEVPNGRVNSNAPEPSESIVTVGETPNSSEDGVMPISETENPTEVVTSEEEVVEGADNVEDQAMEIDAGVDESSVEAEAEPEMWPVYLSLGGIALTLLLIFVINIVHRKSKK